MPRPDHVRRRLAALPAIPAGALRALDPGSGPRKARVLLGHHDPRSAEAYTAAARGLPEARVLKAARTRTAPS